MPIKMTLQEALYIQREQIKHYGHLHPQGVAGLSKVMAARTNVEGMDLTAMRDVAEVNRHVPRGSDIEYILVADYGGD